MRMNRIAGTILLCSLPFTAVKASAAAEDSAWIQLFNGKDLKDWDFKIRFQAMNVDPNHTFKVVDGNLFVDYSEYVNFDKEPFGHMGYKLRKFSHYLLRSEYQFLTGKQVTGGPGWAKENNGFMLHSQSIASMGKDQDFPISLEAQLLGPANGGGTMNLCTPGTNYHDMSGKLITDHCTNATANARQAAPAWTSVSALVLGDSLIKHMVGKDTVFKFTKPVTGGGMVSGVTVSIPDNTPLKDGYIVIQAESAPVLFRKIEVLDLVGCMDKSKPAYRSYFVKSDPAACNATAALRRAEASGFELLREGPALRVRGGGAWIESVRRMDGSLAPGFAARPGLTGFTPAGPGVYLVSVRTATGSAERRTAFF
ncbi:MAG: hypothetical protein JWP91_1124 [Fibrobacteres bacterium]|nr:hypothetical protein [Fibrobacterota bacterium]